MSDSASASFRPELFKNKDVLVSGASRGIGLAIAEGFAALGARVIATSSAPPADRGGIIEFRRLDVRDRDAIALFIGELGGLDVLVNCAGIARPRDEFEPETYLEVMNVNLNSTMWASMAARPMLARSRGSIVSVASMLSYLADPDVPAYCASKTGLLGLTRSLAHEFGPQGIRVNAVAPGYHKTDMTKVHWQNPPVEKKIADRSALKRWGTAEEVVGGVLFLASPAAAFVTGTCLAVDGGFVNG